LSTSTQKTTQAVDLAGLVGKPRTAKQASTLESISQGLSQASNSALIRDAIALGQIERGFKSANGTAEKREKPTEITEAQGARMVKAFGDDCPSKEDLVATKMPYQTAWEIVGKIISADEAVKGTDAEADYTEAREDLEKALPQ